MLTPEQIHNLKPGDTVLVEAEVSSPLKDGAIVSHGCITHALHASELYPLPSEHGTSLSRRSSVGAETEVPTPQHDRTFCHVVENMVKPRYDPCRFFKKGDKVQPRSGKTVLASEYGFVTFHELAGQYEVNEDEARGTVTLIVNGHACFVSAFALELVTPVEELEPYMVETDFVDDEPVWNIYKDGDLIVGYTSSHPNAKAAAEAECARLNAEWRKEQE